MDPLSNRRAVKMNGLGNEIVILDLRGTSLIVSPQQARAIGRGKGLYFDQLMAVHDPVSPGADAFMRIYNIDGSEAGACGNGTRCVAYELSGSTQDKVLRLQTASAVLDCRRIGEWTFSVDMGEPRFGWVQIPLSEPVEDIDLVPLRVITRKSTVLEYPSCVNIGNPHAVFFVDDLNAFEIEEVGPMLETAAIFPDRANISLVRVISRDHLELKVWERGAGPTRACGSAACAALVTASRRELADLKARVTLPGGDLLIEWREADDHVIMTGPVEFEFETKLDPKLFEEIAA